MDLVKITAYARGEYSENEYCEERFITKDSYDIIANKLKESEIYICELDGKHSQCECDIDIEHFNDELLRESNLELIKNGDDLYYLLSELYSSRPITFVQEQSLINEYISTLDTYQSVTVQVRKSQVDKLKAYAKELVTQENKQED